MTTRRTILFAMYDGGGNVQPLLAIAGELVSRGDRVIVLAGPFFGGTAASPSLLERASAAGCEVRTVPRKDDASAPILPGLRGLALGRTGRWFGPLQFTHSIHRDAWRWADATAHVCRTEGIDLVAADDMLPGALIGAESQGVPFISLMHTIYFFRTAPGLPPPGMGLDPASNVFHNARDWFLKRAISRVHSRDALPGLNEARERLGLKPLRHPWQQYDRADQVLVLSSRYFDFKAKRLPDNVVYTGLPFPVETSYQRPAEALQERPLVLVSLSTSDLQQAVTAQTILDAVAPLPVRTIITVTGTLVNEQLRLPANAEAVGFLPHSEVLPSVSALVTHGGHGTVLTALSHGKPVVCTPLFFDQFDIARRLHHSGAGIDVGRNHDESAIRSAVQSVISNPSFTTQAQNLARRMSEERGREHAAELIEGLCAGPRERLSRRR